jgi:hypothetical protein
MSHSVGSPAELRAKVNLTKNEIAHLWNGGVLSLKVEGPARRRTSNSGAQRPSRTGELASSSSA